ncbi:MAG: 2,5 ligase [Rhizobacter sp.]|nr:2,5 ligase [Rhizobacter sp.]
MPDQLSLTGFDPAPEPTDGLFLALFPDAGTASHIADLAQQLRHEHRLRGMPLATTRFHVTLHDLGEHLGLPRDMVASAIKAAATVAMPPVELRFDVASSFGRSGKRPFVLRTTQASDSLLDFQQALGAALKHAGLGRWVKNQYTPHVTLLYEDREVEEGPVERVAWTAHEFVLVHSLLGKTTHIPLGRWPLRG